MDLSSMLNDGPAPDDKKPSVTPPRSKQRSIPPTPGANGLPPGYSSTQPTPLYAPASAGAPLSRQTTGLTPLQTPSQGYPGTQYPFPQQQQQHSQSPAVQHPPGQQYPAYGPQSATTPGARPASHGFQYAQPSPSQYQQHGLPPGMHAPHTASHSPTPSSHTSQTPHSVRQSPLASVSQGPPQQHPQYPYQHQHSQPNTPLGPPPLQYARTPYHGYQEAQSPYHQRQSSGTSNGLTGGSPAQHHPGIGNLVGSPSAYNRQSPQLRRTSDYLSQVDRERSLSVSPKTKVLPRALSQGSRQSSQQESYSSRSSLQHQQSAMTPVAETPNHVLGSTPLNQYGVAHPSSSTVHSHPIETPQGVAPLLQTPYSAAPPVNPALEHSLSHPNHHPQPAIQHHPEKMSMNRLLTPASSVTSMDGASEGPIPRQRKQQETNIFMRPSPKPKRPAVAPPPAQAPVLEDRSGAADATAVLVKAEQQPPVLAAEVGVQREPFVKQEMLNTKPSNKRPAESEALPEHPTKRGRVGRKYTERPVWATLHPRNPKYSSQGNGSNGTPSNQRPQNRANQGQPISRQPNGMAAGHPAQHVQQQQPRPQPNGQVPSAGANGKSPAWLQDPPIDEDLKRAREIFRPQFGGWEKSIQWNEPITEMCKQVQDWLYLELMQLQDIPPFEAGQGHIEIEAKIGRILRSGTDDRLTLPIKAPTVLDIGWASQEVRFESQMDVHEHKAMNDFLNATTRQSQDPGRVKILYTHPHELDSFLPLSAAGYTAIPPAFKRHIPAHKISDLKIRSTKNLKENGKLTARIIKLRVSDLHIFNPAGDYDCRISINLEVNMNAHTRPDLPSFDELVEEWKSTERPAPDRVKDRLSYEHLAYRIDLTKVEVGKTLAAKYELELEVDAEVLRAQAGLLGRGEVSGFGDLVGGFLGNATLLMRQRRAGQ